MVTDKVVPISSAPSRRGQKPKLRPTARLDLDIDAIAYAHLCSEAKARGITPAELGQRLVERGLDVLAKDGPA